MVEMLSQFESEIKCFLKALPFDIKSTTMRQINKWKNQYEENNIHCIAVRGFTEWL